MLEGVETVVGQFGGVRVAVNAKDAAVMFRVHGLSQRAQKSKPGSAGEASPNPFYRQAAFDTLCPQRPSTSLVMNAYSFVLTSSLRFDIRLRRSLGRSSGG